MSPRALILTRIRFGWAVDLTGGWRLASFWGPGAHMRALRYVGQLIGGHDRFDRQSRR
jgi:hypothetical protein